MEETGLDPSSIVDNPIVVDRDTIWNGRHCVSPESFFLARFPSLDGPALTRAGLMPDEQQNLRGTAWVTRAELLAWPDRSAAPERLEPPTLAAEIARLAPDWVR